MAVTTTKSRKPFAILNLIFSIFLLIVSIGVVLSAGSLVNSRFFSISGKIRTFTDSFFTAMLIAGLTTFIVAILGGAVIKI